MTEKEAWEAARKFNEEWDELITPNLAPNQKTNLYNRFCIALWYDCITQEDYESIMNIIENAEKRKEKKIGLYRAEKIEEEEPEHED